MDGAGSHRLCFIFFERPAEQPFNGKHAFGTEIRHGRQICRASHIAHRLNPARILHIIPIPLQLRHPAGHAEQRRQMSTRGHSPNADAVRIEMVGGSIRAKPSHGSLTIFDLRRKRCSAAKAIIDARHGDIHPAPEQQLDISLFCPAPASTMNTNDHWQRTRRPSPDNRGRA